MAEGRRLSLYTIPIHRAFADALAVGQELQQVEERGIELLAEEGGKNSLFGLNLENWGGHRLAQLGRLSPETENSTGLIGHLVDFLASLSNLEEGLGVGRGDGVEQGHQVFPRDWMDWLTNCA